MADKPIIFSGPMVRALLDGRKTQTRRVLKPWPGMQAEWLTMKVLHSAPTCYLATVDGHLGAQMQHPLAGTSQPYGEVEAMSPLSWVRLPYAPGDRLWVREAHSLHHAFGQGVEVGTEDDGRRWGPWGGLPTQISPDGRQIAYFREGFDRSGAPRWRPSIHMPRWASRLTLIVTDVRVQRVQEISEADAIAEGVRRFGSAWSVEKDNGHGAGSNTAAGCFRLLWNSLHGPDAWGANPWVVALTFDVHRCNIDRSPDS